MNNLFIEKTQNTPLIDFDASKKELIISGESRPENAVKFYDQIINWLNKYNAHLFWLSNQEKTFTPVNFHFEFEYFNSTSAKYLFDVFKCIKKANAEKKLYHIIWWHDELDTDIKEAGIEFSELANTKFEFKTF